jgi:citrate lyase beta subunit
MSLNHNQIGTHRHFYLGTQRCRSILLIEGDQAIGPCKPDALAFRGQNLKARLGKWRRSDMGTLPFLLCISATLDHDAFDKQLSELMAQKPNGLILTDAKSRADGERLDAMLRVEEAMSGLLDGDTVFLAMLGGEIAGMANAIAIAQSSTRIIAIGQDSRAIVNAIGAKTPTAAQSILQTTRTQSQLAGASANIPVFDVLASDQSEVATEAKSLINAGFHALISDDPHRIDQINTAFENASRP